MCGRFSIAVRISVLAERFGIRDPPGIPLPRYNIAPSEEIPVVLREHDKDENYLVLMRWGLTSPWAGDPVRAPAVINARAEGIGKKPMFRDLMATSRCIIPVSGFYEWDQSPGKRVPHYITMKGIPLFAVAGLFDSRRTPADNSNLHCAIITTGSNPVVSPFHHRMPAVLSKRDERAWLDPDEQDREALAHLLRTYAPDEMEEYPVTALANRPSFKSEEAVRPVESSRAGDLAQWGIR